MYSIGLTHRHKWRRIVSTCLCAASLVTLVAAGEAGEEFAVKLVSKGVGTRNIRMRFVGSNPTPAIEQVLEQKGEFRDGPYAEAVDNVSTRVRKVVYREIYPGIDLASYTLQGRVCYDLILESGADPESIRIVYEGFENVELFAELPGYQIVQGSRIDVPVLMEKTPEKNYRLVIDRYDRAHNLVIPTTSVPIQAKAQDLAMAR